MEPIKLEFIVKGDIDNELTKIKLAIKGVGDESYTSFKRLLNSSNESFNGLSRVAQGQAVVLQRVIQELRQNEAAQEALYESFEKGSISANDYAQAQARLSAQQADLKRQASDLNRELQREIQLNGKVADSLEQKITHLSSLKSEYSKLTQEERENEQIGGKIVEKVKVLNREIEEINNNFRSEKTAINLVSGSLQEKITILAKLREEYARLNKEERENEKIGGQLITRIRELNREVKNINEGMKDTKTESGDLTDALEMIPGPIGNSVSQFKQLLSTGKAFMSSGLGMFVAGLASAFFVLKTGIEGSEQATLKLNAKGDYFKSIFSTHKKMLTESMAAIYNLITGDTDAMNSNLQAFTRLQMNQVLYAQMSEQATLNQNKVNKLEERNNGLILANTSAIEQYRTGLMDVNKTFEERKKLGEDILKLEKENSALKLDVISEKYKVFIEKSFDGLERASEQFPEQTKLAQQYFDTLTKGGELTLTQQQQLINAINDITSGLDKGWDDQQKAQFRSYFTDALSATKDYYSKTREVSTNLSNIIKQQANEAAKANKKTALQKLQEEVKLYKEQYAILYAYERNMGKEAADEAFKDLRTKGTDFIAYLSNNINELQNKPNRTKADDINLGYLQKTRQEVAPKFDASAFKNSIEEKKKLYKEDLDGYVAYLEKLRKLMNQDTSTAGTQKRIILDLEIKDQREEQQKQLKDMVKNYQTFALKMSSLEKSYQQDMTRLGKAYQNTTNEEDKKRYGEAIEARTNAYQLELAQMEADNSGFSRVLSSNLEKISRSALKKALSEAKAFVKKWKEITGSVTPEMQAFIQSMERGVEDIEKQERGKLASNLQEVSGFLKDCAGSASQFNEELGESINISAQLVGAIAQMASGNYLSAAFTAITSVVSHIAQSNAKAIAYTKQIEGSYWDAVNWKIERQIKLMKELADISSEQVGQSIQNQINELLDTLAGIDLDVKMGNLQTFLKKVEEGANSALKNGNDFAANFLKGFWDAFGDKNKADADGHWNFRFYDVLKDLSQDEIISLQGIPEIWSILPEEIQNYIKQLSDAVDKQKELNESTKETLTNTTSSAITDSIVQGFLNGKRSAEDFADDFKGLMREAMMQSIKMQYLEKPLQQWYEQFAKDSENGLTEDKINMLRNQYNAILNDAAKHAEEMEKITGIGLTDAAEDSVSDENSLKGALAKASQESIDLLAGQTGALRVTADNTYYKLTSLYTLQERGWNDVTEIKKTVSQIEGHAKRTSEAIDHITTIGVKINMN